MQHQLLAQLPLSQRIPALADAIRSLRAATAQNAKEEAEYLALLKQAEQELKAHPAGSEGVEPTGLLDPEPAPEPEPEPAPAKAKAKK